MKNLLTKHFSKKTLRLLTIATGVVIIAFYFVVNSTMNKIVSTFDFDSIGVLAFASLFFYIIFVLTTALILYYSYLIYFKNNDRSDISVVIIFGVYCAFAVVLLLNIQTIIFFMKLASMTSIYDFYDIASSISSVDFAFNLLKLMAFVLLGVAVYSGYLLNNEKGLVSEQPMATATSTENTSTAEKTPEVEKKPNEVVQKIKAFIATKKGKIIIGGVSAALLIGIVTINILSNQKTKVDLTKNVEIEFYGTDGEGYAKIAKNKWDYDGNDRDVKNFLDSVYFVIEDDEGLSNGDEVEVIAKYYDQDADKYKVAPTNTKKTIKVEGLDIEYASYDDLTKKEKKTVEDAWDEFFDDGDFEDEIRYELKYDFKDDPEMTISDKAVVARYYGEGESAGNDILVYVVKVTVEGKERYRDEDKTLTKYYKIAVENITPETVEDIDSSSFYISYNSDLSADTDEKAKKEVVKYYEKDSWTKYEMIEIK